MTSETNATEIREAVRRHYAAAATQLSAAHSTVASCCSACSDDAAGTSAFGSACYDDETSRLVPGGALAASLGCGVPTAVADLRPGETVLDLGSGAGTDVLIAARRVAPHGRVIGIDMTPEMVELAWRHASEANVTNVVFLQGFLEDLPVPDASIDVVMSNCVINLAGDKNVVLREAARVLRPGGRLAISDVIADEDLDDATRADVALWTGCIAGALTHAEFEVALAGAGLTDIEITETHRVHAMASSAIIRARRPGGAVDEVHR